MAIADQIKALLKSHIEGDESRFFSIAMQVAAHEAKLGHGKFAEELRDLIDAAKVGRASGAASNLVPLNRPRGELAGLLTVSYPQTRVGDMILQDIVLDKLHRTIKEQQSHSKLREHGLSPRRKLLLVGAPGTGKTMTASALAGELGIPLFLVRLDALITKFMGETAAKLRQVFDSVEKIRGVYFFDEFDAIGSQRSAGHDVGEIRRVLNSFLQMIEQDRSNSLIIAATNHREILDYALFRRFDDVIEYSLPNTEQIISMLRKGLAHFSPSKLNWTKLAQRAEGLSYSEISRAIEESVKSAILHDKKVISGPDLERMLEERKLMSNKLLDNKDNGRLNHYAGSAKSKTTTSNTS